MWSLAYPRYLHIYWINEWSTFNRRNSNICWRNRSCPLPRYHWHFIVIEGKSMLHACVLPPNLLLSCCITKATLLTQFPYVDFSSLCRSFEEDSSNYNFCGKGNMSHVNFTYSKCFLCQILQPVFSWVSLATLNIRNSGPQLDPVVMETLAVIEILSVLRHSREKTPKPEAWRRE